MGAHSAGRRVRAPGRRRWLNRAVEAAAVTGLVGVAALAGWVSFQPPPHSPGLDPQTPGATSVPADPPVPPVPAAALLGGHSSAVHPTVRARRASPTPVKDRAGPPRTTAARPPRSSEACS